MFERMLNKRNEPSFEELIDYCGSSGRLWLLLEEFLLAEFDASKLIRFPYGNSYGWGVKYSKKNKHICDVFAENGSFTAQFQVSARAVESVYDELDDYGKGVWANKYPCASGGWVSFRVIDVSHLDSLKKVIMAKMKPQTKKSPSY